MTQTRQDPIPVKFPAVLRFPEFQAGRWRTGHPRREVERVLFTYEQSKRLPDSMRRLNRLLVVSRVKLRTNTIFTWPVGAVHNATDDMVLML